MLALALVNTEGIYEVYAAPRLCFAWIIQKENK